MEDAGNWQQQREQDTRQVESLRRQGICDTCYDLTTLHLQLLPRYHGEKIGSTCLVAARRPLQDGEELAQRVRAALV